MSRSTLRASQLETPAQRAGLEESLRSEDELLEHEMNLVERLAAEAADYKAKVRVGGHANDNAVREAVGHNRDRTFVILPLVRQYSEGDIYVVEPPDLEPVGRVGTWRGPMGTLFIESRLWREAPTSAFEEAFRKEDFELLEAWAASTSTPQPTVTASEPAAAEPAPKTPTVSAPPPAPEVKPAPSPTAVKPAPTPVKALAPKPKVKLNERTLSELLEEILDRRQWGNRGAGDWGVLHRELFNRLLTTKKIWTTAAVSDEQKVLKATAKRIQGTVIQLSLEDALLMGDHYSKFPDQRYQLLIIAAIAFRIQEGIRADRALGVPPEVPEVDCSLDSEEILRRLRTRSIRQNPTEDYLLAPNHDMVGYATDSEYRRLGDKTPFNLAAILTAEWEGLDATLRPIELVQAIIRKGVRRIELLPAGPRSPPALLVHLRRPFTDPAEQKALSSLAVALLKRPIWQSEQQAELLPEGMTGEQWIEQGARWIDARMADTVEFNAAQVQEFVFAEAAPAAEKLEKLRRLIDKALRREVALRAPYQPYDVAKVGRMAYALGRTEGERRATAAHLDLILTSFEHIGEAQKHGWRRDGTRERERTALKEEFQEIERRALLLEFLGASELEGDPEAARRSDHLLKRLETKGHSFVLEEWALYRPLLKLPFLKGPEGQWLLSDSGATFLLNRMGEAVRPLRDALPGQIEGLLSGWLPEPRQLFLAELNLGVLRALLKRPPRGTTLEQLSIAMLGESVLPLRDAQPVPPPSGRRFLARRSRLEERAQAAQRQISGLGQEAPEKMEETLADLEAVGIEMARLGGPVPATDPPPVNLESKVDAESMLRDLAALRDWMAPFLEPGVSPAVQLKLDEFRQRVREMQSRGDVFAKQAKTVVARAEQLLAQVVGISTSRQIVRQMQETEQEITALAGKLVEYPNLTEPLDAAKKRLQVAQAFVEELRQLRAVLPGDPIQVRALLESSKAMAASLAAEVAGASGSATTRPGSPARWKETLGKGRAELVGRVVSPVETSVLALLKSVWGPKEVEQANRLLETLPRLAALLRSDGSFEADAQRLEEYSPRLQAAIDKTKRGLEKMDADQAKVENEQLLRESSSLPKVAEILRTDHRFSQFIVTEKDEDKDLDWFTRRLADREPFGKVTGLAHAVKTRMEAELAKGKMGNYKTRAFQALLRIAEMVLEPHAHHDAGLEEVLTDSRRISRRLQARTARETRNVVIFLHRELFAEADLRALDDLALIGLGVEIREALATAAAGRHPAAGRGGRDLQLVLVPDADLPRFRELYRGWRIVQVRRRPGSDARPLPVSAVPVVVAQALASGRPVFEIVVTPYLRLGERTLPQVLDELAALVAV